MQLLFWRVVCRSRFLAANNFLSNTVKLRLVDRTELTILSVSRLYVRVLVLFVFLNIKL